MKATILGAISLLFFASSVIERLTVTKADFQNDEIWRLLKVMANRMYSSASFLFFFIFQIVHPKSHNMSGSEEFSSLRFFRSGNASMNFFSLINTIFMTDHVCYYTHLT